LLLLDIARSFEVQVGTAGLTASVGAISGVVFGLLMAVLSVRFNHKIFLLIGLVCTCLAALGFFLAPTFLLLLVPNIGVGAGIAMVTAMAYSIIGDVYPLEKRGRAIGVIVSATTLAYVIGAPTIDIIADWGGWRLVMIALSTSHFDKLSSSCNGNSKKA
jgi:predicted MFS family arabinose efflux permease